VLITDFKASSPEDFAKLFTFLLLPEWKKESFSNLQNKIGNRWKAVFGRNRYAFELLSSFKEKYKFDSEDYLNYFVTKEYDHTLDEDRNIERMVNVNLINAYADSKSQAEKYRKIFGYFQKSANFVAQEAIKAGYRSSKKFIVDLIKADMLGNYVVSGSISIYYLASIANFDNLLEKIQNTTLTGKTLEFLHYNFDFYALQISEAYTKMTNSVCHTFSHTDRILQKILDQ